MDVTPPPEGQGSPYGGSEIPGIVFDTFSGLNTEASRPGIEDTQLAWCDGYMPIGKNNLRVLPGVGPALFSVVGISATIVWYDFGNISTTPYMVVLLSDGSLRAVNTVTGNATLIGASGTITNPNIATIGLSQWGSQYLVIVAKQTNGLFIWNGTTLSTAGTLGPDVTLTNDGFDYTSVPTVTAYGGTGSGATFLASINAGGVVSVSVTNPGAGYSNNDGVALAFSGGGNPNMTATATATVSSGSVTAVNMVNQGSGYTSTTSVSFIGGGGFGATATVVPSGGSISSVSVVMAGQGYTTAPTPVFSDVNNTLAVATVDLMPFGVEGTTCETYQSRLWVANGAQIQVTAPESLTDFSPADGGDSFTSNDSFLRVGFQRLVNTNGFLYLIADSSVNYISGVNTSGSPPITTFTNQNADPEIGTPYEATVDVFSSNIVFANAFGVHVNYGGRVVKVSEPLDGVFNTVVGFDSFTPSSAKAIIFGKRVWMLLIPVIDPITNTKVNKLFMWNGKIWWSSQQDVPLIYVRSQEINSVLTAYGTDGTTIYPLFQQPSTGFTKTVQSKLWDKPGGYSHGKAVNLIWGAAYYYSDLSPELNVTIDNETGGQSQVVNLGPNLFVWTNNTGGTISWTNNTGGAIVWGNSGVGVVIFPPTAVAQQGVLTGLTITTNAADLALISVTIQPEVVQYRG